MEVEKPFLQEQELKDKTARLAVLDKELNMSAMRSATPKGTDIVAKRERSSILDSLKQPPPHRKNLKQKERNANDKQTAKYPYSA